MRVAAPPAASWPFLYPLGVNLPSGPAAIVVSDLHEAFANHQTAGTRLVTTQATYLFLTWMEIVGERDVIMLATADSGLLEQHAPELLHGRGIFEGIVTGAPSRPKAATARSPRSSPDETLRAEAGASRASDLRAASGVEPLVRAFRSRDPRQRLEWCVGTLDESRTPGTLLATASVCMEVNDLDAAARDLDEVLSQAPEWAAAHFERGKLWLRRDEMERASESFRAAAERMPRFGAAWSNLGATLGELDRTQEALAAFERALKCDRSSAQTHNNIGVVSRELGRLADSEKAFNRVIALAPDLAFGYYNLGHTLFLQGRYHAALSAYVSGQKRDPEQNVVQATRLAMCRLATGDAAGAIAELQRVTAALPREYRQQLLADTHTIAWAVLTHRPDLPGWQQVNEWLMRETQT